MGLGGLPYEAPYALSNRHKHIPEMVCYAGLDHDPQFVPAVGPFRCGMRVEVPLHASFLPPGTTGGAVWEVFRQRYQDEPFVRLVPQGATIEERSLNPQACNDTNRLELHVLPHPSGHILLVATLDNLGKGGVRRSHSEPESDAGRGRDNRPAGVGPASLCPPWAPGYSDTEFMQ